MNSPTQRTKALLITLGYKVWITERWNQFAHVRQDMFGFIDLIAIHPELRVTVGVQTTSFEHRADHFRKIYNEPRAKDWLNSGNTIQLITWKKLNKNGKVVRYLPDFVEIKFGVTGELIGVLSGDKSEYILENLEENQHQSASPSSNETDLVGEGDS